MIRKPAAPGMEDKIGVILQAHMDMVAQKDPDVIHDFNTDPIETEIVEPWLRQKGQLLARMMALVLHSLWQSWHRRI